MQVLETGGVVFVLQATESVEQVADLWQSVDEELRNAVRETVLSFGKTGHAVGGRVNITSHVPRMPELAPNQHEFYISYLCKLRNMDTCAPVIHDGQPGSYCQSSFSSEAKVQLSWKKTLKYFGFVDSDAVIDSWTNVLKGVTISTPPTAFG